jgi:hypothetical protein
VTSDGRILEVELLRGDWRKSASRASDQSDLFYAPPEQVPSEMDRLIGLHATHLTMGVSPDIEAAWLHHRFTQIHPFQDGNGRVARCLASLVLIQARWFPLSIVDEKRDAYIAALRTADNGDLSPLITIFADAQKKAFVKSLSLLRQVADEGKESRAIVAAVANRIVAQRIQTNATRCEIASHLADALVGVTLHKFESVKQEIEVGLRVAAPQTRIFIDSSKPENTTWFGGDIIWAAKEYDYFANRRDFAAWVRLKIVVDNDTELLISFHVPGYQYRGLLACAPLIFRREHGEDGSTTIDHQTLSEAPFYFSYVDTIEEVKARFEKWLEEVVQNGLIYWQELP